MYFLYKKTANNIIDTLYDMLKDPARMVTIASIQALEDIMQDQGGMAVNSQIIIFLLDRLKVKILTKN